MSSAYEKPAVQDQTVGDLIEKSAVQSQKVGGLIEKSEVQKIVFSAIESRCVFRTGLTSCISTVSTGTIHPWES